MEFKEFKRHHDRKQYRADVSFVHQGKVYNGTMKDLSLGGAFIVTSWVNNFSRDDVILLNIPYTSGKKIVKRKAFIKWFNNEGFGIEFI